MTWFSLPVALPALVGSVSAAIAFVCARAARSAANPKIVWVAAGFVLLSCKSFVKSWHLSYGPESDTWEIVLSFLDLLSVALIAWPLLSTWGRRRG